jgi:hypothetical protein
MRVTRRTKWLLLLCLLPFSCMGGSCCLLIAIDSHEISRAHFERLEQGMTVEEVVNCFGGAIRLETTQSWPRTSTTIVAYQGQGIFPRATITVTYVDGTLRTKQYERESVPAFIRRLVGL